jgi:hypothetical protein
VLHVSGEFVGCTYPVLDRRRRPLPFPKGLGTPRYPHHPLPVGECFRGFTGLHCYDLSSGSPRSVDPNGIYTATQDLYTWASIGLVTLPDARYDYAGNWAVPAGGTLTRWNSI